VIKLHRQRNDKELVGRNVPIDEALIWRKSQHGAFC
jgi:hypothetical protein